ncbi:MAG: TlyA family RNA methyltransferase [Desulfitobacterium sp.]|nr:TlyA family RNA methyltransferase [Desulfitobacterium sp.]
MSKSKKRLDVLLVKRGLAPSREKAKATIMAGLVLVDGERVDKPGTEFLENVKLELKGESLPYVSRGGLKLEKALKVFPVSLQDAVVADIGASTGGFTDCALQNGAAKVYAIDVGYGQLDWKLRTDPRVVCMERVNARYLTETSLPEKVDYVVCDVAFISVTKIFSAMNEILQDKGQILTLIKPQFEAGKEHVGKKGVVRDPQVHEEVLQKVLDEAEKYDFIVKGIDYSPIRGPEGNIEYLAWFSKEQGESIPWQEEIVKVVQEAHSGRS